MSELASLQRRFLDYMRHANPEIESDIAAGDENERSRRLSIYYNAYRARLYGSVETDHTILGRYLGDELFDEMVRQYIDVHPSAQTSLRHFCDQLPAFLSTTVPFAETPVIAELAKFERLLMDVFDAADASCLNREHLSTLQAEQWPGLTFQFHPSMRTFISHWQSVEIWQAIKADRVPPHAQNNAETNWLLWRNREQLSEFRSLPDDEATMLSTAAKGKNFAEICEGLLTWHADEAVAGCALSILQQWFDAGLVTALESDGD